MDTGISIVFGLAYVALGVAVLVIAKLAKDLVTPYKIDDELTGKDNPALGLAMAGYFLAVVIIFLGASIGPEPEEQPTVAEMGMTVVSVLGYSLFGIVLLNIGQVILDKVVLNNFSVKKEIIEDRNAGTGAVVGGAYVATALVVAGAIYGETVGAWWHGPISALVFFVLGQGVLALFGVLYRVITKYDLHAEIEKDNVAAGVAFALSVVAIGIVLLRATGQDFNAIAEAVAVEKALAVEQAIIDNDPSELPELTLADDGTLAVPLADKWRYALVDFAYYSLGGFVVLVCLRRVTDALLLRGSTIYEEIARDRNLNAAFIEGAVAVGIAGIVYFML
ncbi:MAG: DUF350 domain-containing protein [Planctomycetota bacterium]